MHLRWQVHGRFVKAFCKAFLEIVGVPGAILILFLLLGISIDPKIIDAASALTKQYGAVIFAALVVFVAMETTYQIVKSDREEFTQRFYAANPEARINRAHVEFYRLWRAANRNAEAWDLKQKQIMGFRGQKLSS